MLAHVTGSAFKQNAVGHNQFVHLELATRSTLLLDKIERVHGLRSIAQSFRTATALQNVPGYRRRYKRQRSCGHRLSQ